MTNEGLPLNALNAPMGYDGAMYMSHEEHMVSDQRMQRETEVYHNAEGVPHFVEGHVVPHIIDNPDIVTYVAVVAESGAGKGPIIAGVADELFNNEALRVGLERQGKELACHYSSTAICALYAEENGLVRKGYWGRYDPEKELSKIFIVEKYGTLLASVRLPELDPNKAHVVLVEAVIVADDLLSSLAQNRNAFFIVSDTDLDVQENSAQARDIIWSPMLTDKQKKKALAEKGIVYDTSRSEEIMYSMGNRPAIDLVIGEENKRMLRDKAHLKLPAYLDDFTEEDLRSNPNIRSAVQRFHYEYLLRYKWGLVCERDDPYDSVTVRGLHTSNKDLRKKDEDQSGVTIHSHPDFLNSIALKLDDILDLSFLKHKATGS